MIATLIARRWQIAVAIGGLSAGLLWLIAPADDPLLLDVDGVFVLFLAAAVVGELLRVDTPRGQPTAASLGVLAAYALLGGSPLAAAVIAGLAWLIAAGLRGAMGVHSELGELGHRVITAWALPGLAAAGEILAPWLVVGPGGITLVGTVTVTAGLLAGPAIWDAAVEHGATLPRIAGLVHERWAVAVALGSSAALAAVSYDLLGGWGLALLALPVVAVRAGLHRFVGIRRTYDQTIVAMSRMTELTGHVAPGHGIRVAQVAVAIARELGMSETDVRTVERGAYLHEVGRIATDDPDTRAHDDEVAQAGAAIVDEAGDLPEVAEVVGRLREPYRIPGDGGDSMLPITARIVRTACEFDRLRSAEVETWEALDTLHRAMAYDHDPRVVIALEGVLARDLAPSV